MNGSSLLSPGLLLLAACNPAPLKTGTLIQGTSTAETITKSYKNIDGTVVERAGNKGFGANCTEAGEPTVLSTTTATLTRAHTWEVVGETFTDQPLDPEEGGQGRTAVSVVAEQIISRGDVFVESLAYDAGPEGEDVTSFDQAPNEAVTASRYFGLAGDKYLVELSPLDLWTPVSFAEAGAGGDPDRMDLLLVTKRAPTKNDVWTSLDGNTLFLYQGKETISVGGEDYNANKVGVYIVAESDPEVASIIDDCLYANNFQDVTKPGLEEDNVVSTSVLLDPGCDGAFLHQQVGTQWWSKDILLKSEGTRWDVTISDHGYEWYVQEGDTCTRFTGPVAPETTPSKLFVQYSVTRTDESYKVDSIGEAKGGGQ